MDYEVNEQPNHETRMAVYAALLLDGWSGPVVTWKDEGPEGPIHHYPSADVFCASFGRPKPVDPERNPLWLSRRAAQQYAKAHRAKLVVL